LLIAPVAGTSDLIDTIISDKVTITDCNHATFGELVIFDVASENLSLNIVLSGKP